MTQPKQARIRRMTYVVGSVIFILIGLLHTVTQLTELSSDEVRTAYRAGGPIDVSGTTIDGWHLFAGTSLLMGFFAIGIGAINLAALIGRTDPPAAVAAVNIAVLLAVVVVGRLHLTAFQAVGGIIGILLFLGPASAGVGREPAMIE